MLPIRKYPELRYTKLFGPVFAFLSVIPEGNLLLVFRGMAAWLQRCEYEKQIPFGNDRKKGNCE
jgi:hypothetical protein